MEEVHQRGHSHDQRFLCLFGNFTRVFCIILIFNEFHFLSPRDRLSRLVRRGLEFCYGISHAQEVKVLCENLFAAALKRGQLR